MISWYYENSRDELPALIAIIRRRHATAVCRVNRLAGERKSSIQIRAMIAGCLNLGVLIVEDWLA